MMGNIGFQWVNLFGMYLFKVNSENTRKISEVIQVKTKTPERRHWRRSDVYKCNFEQISHNVLFLL